MDAIFKRISVRKYQDRPVEEEKSKRFITNRIVKLQLL